MNDSVKPMLEAKQTPVVTLRVVASAVLNNEEEGTPQLTDS